jgi:uncharacterized protein YjbJ (UPF0337 family)
MKWQQIEDKWQQFAGSAKTRWDKFSEDDWVQISGKRDRLVRRIEEAYGVPREEAEEQVEEWATRFREQEVRHS